MSEVATTASKVIANVEKVLLVDAELRHFALGLNGSLGKMPPFGLGCTLRLPETRTQLHRGIAVFVGRARGDNLAIAEFQNGDRNMPPVFGEEAGHAQFLRDDSGAHVWRAFRA